MDHYCGSDAPPFGNWYRRYEQRSYAAPNSNLRVSDSERHEMADILGRHYADGRLDKNEFDERVSQAMAAKTHSDLSGLLSDLPRVEPVGGPMTPMPPRRRHRGLLELCLIAAIVLAIGGVLAAPWHLGWLVFVLIALFVWDRRGRRFGSYRWHSHSDSGANA